MKRHAFKHKLFRSHAHSTNLFMSHMSHAGAQAQKKHTQISTQTITHSQLPACSCCWHAAIACCSIARYSTAVKQTWLTTQCAINSAARELRVSPAVKADAKLSASCLPQHTPTAQARHAVGFHHQAVRFGSKHAQGMGRVDNNMAMYMRTAAWDSQSHGALSKHASTCMTN